MEGDAYTTEELAARAALGGTDRCWPKCAGGHLMRWYGQFERPTHLYGRVLRCDICSATIKEEEDNNVGTVPFINCVRCNYVVCHSCITGYNDVLTYRQDPTYHLTQDDFDAMYFGEHH